MFGEGGLGWFPSLGLQSAGASLSGIDLLLDYYGDHGLFVARKHIAWYTKNMKDSKMQVASIIINPHTGGVMAMTGGIDYTLSQYNRAISSKRQVGSAIKPFLYYAALENGMVSSSTFLSEPTTFMFSTNQSYSPANYNDKYANKNITMAAALAYSDNIYAVKTHLFLGEEVLVNTTSRIGIKEKLVPLPSLALGTSELSMIDFARGYPTLASGGYKRDITFIEKVEDMNGNVLYKKNFNDELVLNKSYTYILNENAEINGIKDIVLKTGSKSFLRLKIGIGKSSLMDTKDYVLGKFSSSENKILEELFFELVNVMDDFKDNGFFVYAADMDGQNYKDVDFANKVLLVIGSEGNGVGRLVKKNCDQILAIPMSGHVNSLNASVAAAILIYGIVNK